METLRHPVIAPGLGTCIDAKYTGASAPYQFVNSEIFEVAAIGNVDPV